MAGFFSAVTVLPSNSAYYRGAKATPAAIWAVTAALLQPAEAGYIGGRRRREGHAFISRHSCRDGRALRTGRPRRRGDEKAAAARGAGIPQRHGEPADHD